MFLIPSVTVFWPEQKNPFLKCESPHSRILFTCKAVPTIMARKVTNSWTLTPSHITDPISHTFTVLTSSEVKNKNGMRKTLQWSCQSWTPNLWHRNPVTYKRWGRDAEKPVAGYGQSQVWNLEQEFSVKLTALFLKTCIPVLSCYGVSSRLKHTVQ